MLTPPSWGVTIRILVADDHPVVRAGTMALIANESDMTVVAEAASRTSELRA
jgi:DNA-binding NarL/FixJ family response regulator